MSEQSITYFTETEPVPGVTEGWLYLHHGKPGPGLAAKMARVIDPDGQEHWMQTGEFRPITVVDDMAAS